MTKMVTISLLLAFILLFVGAVDGGVMANLSNYLSKRHTKLAAPDGLIEVFYEIELVHINNIDELKQKMSVVVYVVEEWIDETLKWDPNDFNGTNTTWMPLDSIWVPDIIVFNMLEYVNLLESIRMSIKVHSDGKVIYSYPALYSVMCEITTSDFPFDEQTCSLDIASWGYSEEKLKLNVSTKNQLAHYSKNEEWALKNLWITKTKYEHEGIVVSEARVIIQVRRKPLHYLVSLVVPSFIISALSIVGLFARFSSNNEKQERFTMGSTAILSMAVLSLVVSEKVPHSSLHVPLLVKYFLFQILAVTFATILTSPILRLHREAFREGSKVPPNWVIKILLLEDTVRLIRKEFPTKNQQTRQITLQCWTSIARRLDYIFTLIFLLLVTAPTLGLIWQCVERLQEEDLHLIRRNLN